MTRALPATLAACLIPLGWGPVNAPGVFYGPIRPILARHQPTIPELLIRAAEKHHLPIGRLLTKTWEESRLRDVTRVEWDGSRSCGPLQVNEGTVPGICEASLETKVDAGARHLAALIARYGDQAEYVYIHGHLPRNDSPKVVGY
jgi:hypothetical protein